MSRHRFKVKQLQEIRKYQGVITLEDLRKKFNIPAHADVVVHVPGGGDWSNTSLNIKDHPIEVTWEEVK